MWAYKVQDREGDQNIADEGANIEAKDNNGSNPLLVGCPKDRDSIARLSIDKGAHVEAKDKFEIPSLDRLSSPEIKRPVPGESSSPPSFSSSTSLFLFL